jgi:ketosteroid isomerase-like protein
LSERNVALVRSLYQAVNEDDLSTFLDLMHTDVELRTSGVYPDFRESYRGHSGAADYWEAARGLWDNFEIEIKSSEVVDDRVLVLLNQHVEGREGIAVDHEWGHLFYFEDGRIRCVIGYDSWQAARQAAGAGSGVRGG